MFKYDGLDILFNNYALKNKKIDANFIYDAVSIIIDKDNTHDIIKEVSFDIPYDKDIYASVYYKGRRLKVNECYSDPDKYLKPINNIFNYNTQILQYILHECSHAKQFKNYIDNVPIEKEILEWTIIGNEIYKDNTSKLLDTLTTTKELYDMNFDFDLFDTIRILDKAVETKKVYELSPAERMAQIRSYIITKELVELSNIYEAKETLYELKKIIERYKRSKYIITNNKIISPLERYYNLLKRKGIPNLDNIIPTLLEYNLSLDDRLYYGIPITKKEYKKRKLTKFSF